MVDTLENYLDQLVALKITQNSCYVRVISAKEAINEYPLLSIDYDAKTWSYDMGKPGSLWGPRGGPRKIGESRDTVRGESNTIIGIYDRTQIDHLNSMVYALEALRDRMGRAVNMD